MSEVPLAPSDGIHAILKIMRAYAYAYTANHDFSVCKSIMVDEYELRMGPYRIVGRDSEYREATQRQFDQFPGLGFTVHDVVTNGERVALRFSEHGRSNYRNVDSAWGGVSLYQWNRSRLTSCLVEQDYFSRRRQLDSGDPNPLEAPAIDPWNIAIEPSSPTLELAVREWVEHGGIDESSVGSLDDEWCALPQRFELDVQETVLDDIFSAGTRVAFHVTQSGTLSRDESEKESSKPWIRHAAGIADLASGSVEARIITDRIEIKKRLDQGHPSDPSN